MEIMLKGQECLPVPPGDARSNCSSDGCSNLVKRPHLRSGSRSNKPYIYKYCQPCLNLKKAYGITSPIRDKMLLAQNGLCGNTGCRRVIHFSGRNYEGDPASGHTDHNHITGKLRGILCRGCNISLGLLYEDVDRIKGLAAYLEQYEQLCLSHKRTSRSFVSSKMSLHVLAASALSNISI